MKSCTVIVTADNAGAAAAALEELRKQQVAGSVQVIQVIAATNRAAAWNAAVNAAEGEALVFLEAGIKLLDPQGLARLGGHLDNAEAVGITGTLRLAGPAWHQAGPPHLLGQYLYPRPDGDMGLVIFAVPARLVTGVMAIDAPLWACTRAAATELRFDEATFTGTDFVDADFSCRLARAGRRVGVVCDVPVLRHPPRYGKDWRELALRFGEKHAAAIKPMSPRLFWFMELRYPTMEAALLAMRPPFWDAEARA